MKKLRIFPLLIMVLLSFISIQAEEIGYITYKGNPNNIDGSTLNVPQNAVALSDYLYLSPPDTSVADTTPPSIMFIIDNSGSMGWSGRDPNGERYDAVISVIDSLVASGNGDVEVGIAVFQYGLTYEHTLPQVSRATTAGNNGVAPSNNYNGGYVMLTTLDSNYVDKDGNTVTGAELLKSYLVHNGNDWRLDEDLEDANAGGVGTNINIGMLAYRDAMKKGKNANNPGNQFGIFISDGEPSDNTSGRRPDNPTTAFTTYDSIPTTFTAFITDKSGVPTSIQNFTDNVIAKNYSGHVPSDTMTSAIAFSVSGLQEYLFDDVLPKILGAVQKPSEVIINGGTSGVTWDPVTGKARLDGPTPLVAITETFNMILTNVKETISDDGHGSIDTLYDTTYDTIDYDVYTDANLPLGEPGLADTVEWAGWDRTLTARQGGVDVNPITGSEDSVELSFNWSPGDAGYTYTSVKVQVVTRVTKDTMNLTFTKVPGENRFAKKIARTTIGRGVTPNRGNSVLEHYGSDQLELYFANSEADTPKGVTLPRDTLRALIPIYTFKENSLDAVGASLYDKDADGHPDSLVVPATGSNLAALKTMLESNLIWPSIYSHGASTLSGTNFIFALTYTNTGYKTSVDAQDRLIIADTLFLDAETIFLPDTIPFVDKMAPVVTSAEVTNGVLTVGFSEVTSSVTNNPYIFLKKGTGAPFSPTLGTGTVSGTQATYTVDNSVEINDSLYFKPTGTVIAQDGAGNKQTNTANHREPISRREDYSITSAVMFDRNADGLADELVVTVDKTTLIDLLAGSIANSLSIGGGNFSFSTGSKIASNKIAVPITYTGSGYKTSLLSSERLMIAENSFGSGGNLLADTLSIVDSMAPVITSASLLDNGTETLTLHYSEPITSSTATNALLFNKKSDGTSYSKSATQSSNTGTQVVYTLGGSAVVAPGDSVHLNINIIKDALGVVQGNSHNRREPISVSRPHSVSQAALFDTNADGHPDALKLTFSGTLGSDLAAALTQIGTLESSELTISGSGVVQGSVITFPVTYSGTVGRTNILAGEKYTIRAGGFGAGGSIAATSLNLVDSMAPVITYAGLVDTAGEELAVQFSEPVHGTDFNNPFIFIKNGTSTTYSRLVTRTGLQVNTIYYSVQNGSPSITLNDSIYINTSVANPVEDTRGKNQTNSKNVRVPIKVERFSTLTTAALFDKDGNGLPDNLQLTFDAVDATIKADMVANIAHLITLSGGVSSYITLDTTNVTALSDTRYEIGISYSDTTIMTIVNGESVTVTAGSFGENGGNLRARTLTVHDSMAPVILSSKLVDSVGEVLTVLFSEPIVAVPSSFSEPFNFYKYYMQGLTRHEIAYSATLTQQSSFGAEVVFTITSVTGLSDTMIIAGDTVYNRGLIERGDSLNISTTSSQKITDLQGAQQQAITNKKAPIAVERIHTITSAALYDTDANGYPDHLTLGVKGRLVGNLADFIDQQISLPTFLNIIPLTADITDTSITLEVQMSDSTADERTWMAGEDVVIAPTTFTGGGILQAGAVVIRDKMAPVAVAATLTDSSGEVLTVDFSEDITPVAAGEPFSFISGVDGSSYSVVLKAGIAVTPRRMSFLIDPVVRDIIAGDSLFIAKNKVADSLPNAQGNVLNVRVPIRVLRTHSVTAAELYDSNADGFPDQMKLSVIGRFGDTLAAYIDSVTTLPVSMEFVAGSGVFVSTGTNKGTITVTINYDTTFGVKTVTDGDLLTTLNLPFGTSGIMLAKSLPIDDKMAPVILTASVEEDITPGNPDKFTVLFSETVTPANVNHASPYLYLKGSAGYTAVLSFVDLTGSVAQYTVTSSDSTMVAGDSVYIDVTRTISDTLGNGQALASNRRAKIEAVRYHLINDAYLYDRNADGYPDEVGFGIQGAMVDSVAFYLKSKHLIALPAGLIYTSDAPVLKGQRVYATVEYSSSTLKTATDSTDAVVVTDDYDKVDASKPNKGGFADGGYLFGGTRLLTDSMAPVISSVKLLDSLYIDYQDELEVTFSENVASFSHDQPFDFVKVNGTTFSALLTLADDSDPKTKRFTIENLLDATGQILEGASIVADDSIYIRTSGTNTILDEHSIGQLNAANRRVSFTGAIDSIHEFMDVSVATFYDDGAQGTVDRIGIEMSGRYIRDIYKEVSQAFVFPAARHITIDSALIIDSTLMIRVKSDLELTSTTDDEVIVGSNSSNGYVLPSGVTVRPQTMQAIDSMAPVVMSAHLTDSITEGKVSELRVSFSEAMELPDSVSELPFRFVRGGTSNQFSMHVVNHDTVEYITEKGDTLRRFYKPILEADAQGDSTIILYHVDAIIGVDHAEDGDSIWVNISDLDPARDVLSNQQNNEGNIRRAMIVDYITDPFSLKLYATKMTRQNSGTKSALIGLNLPALTEQVGRLEGDTYMIFGIMPTPQENFFTYDSLSGVARILDPVGNMVVDGIELVFDKYNKRSVAVWDGKNSSGRPVAVGSYLVVAKVSYYRRNRLFATYNVSQRIMVGKSEGVK